jgi:hypothetical protein
VSSLAPSRISLEDNWSSGAPLRLVLPRDKRDRIAAHAAALRPRGPCGVTGCTFEGLPVVLVEAELDAVLCPVHQLVLLDGSPVPGEPMLATSVW